MSAIFSLYYNDIGILIEEISSIKIFQNVGLLFGLVPSGVLADKIGRLKILNLSSLILAFGFIIIYLFDDVFLL